MDGGRLAVSCFKPLEGPGGSNRVLCVKQVVLLGSLNVLSQHWTREVMLVMEGHHFARKLLEHENATDIATPPACGACGGSEVDLRRRSNGTWFWRCSASTCPARRGTQTWTKDVRLKGRRRSENGSA